MAAIPDGDASPDRSRRGRGRPPRCWCCSPTTTAWCASGRWSWCGCWGRAPSARSSPATTSASPTSPAVSSSTARAGLPAGAAGGRGGAHRRGVPGGRATPVRIALRAHWGEGRPACRPGRAPPWRTRRRPLPRAGHGRGPSPEPSRARPAGPPARGLAGRATWGWAPASQATQGESTAPPPEVHPSTGCVSGLHSTRGDGTLPHGLSPGWSPA
jgi:hypothetical protein